MTQAVAEKSHAALGASSASRWMACPGSVRLSEGMPDDSSAAAEEGTAAHALAELALRNRVDPQLYVGTELEGLEVTEEMAEFVRSFVDHCNELRAVEGSEHWIEHRFNLAALKPPSPMFGTADFVCFDKAARTLHVVDLKYGQGVVVEATGNKQLRYYGLGALLSPALQGQWIERVVLTIVQPRARHPEGQIRSETLPFHALVEFSGDLLAAAAATLDPAAPLAAGEHCRWCKARAVCPEKTRVALAVAQQEFSVEAPAKFTPPAPETLAPEVFADMLSKLHILEDWASAMRKHAYAQLERGEPVPGFKLVAKRATRRWADEARAAQWLEAAGEKPEDIYVRELKSPAQIEKLVGKKNLPGDLVTKVSSGTKMVPEHDPGEAITPGSEFAAIAAGE